MPTLLETAKFNKIPKNMDFRRKVFLIVKNGSKKDIRQLLIDNQNHPGRLGFIRNTISRAGKKLKF